MVAAPPQALAALTPALMLPGPLELAFALAVALLALVLVRRSRRRGR